MKVDPNKIIKTKPKMIKEGYGISDLFTTAILMGALIQILIQIYLTYGGSK
jgi:hypothetical protein